MFALIQRGQLYTDGNGWPVKIQRHNSRLVYYRRLDGKLRSVTIGTFSEQFERIDHQEFYQIQAELEQEAHLKKLRAMKRK